MFSFAKVLRCTSAAEANTHPGTCSSLRKKTTVKIPTQKKAVLFYVEPLIKAAGRPRKRQTTSTPLFLVAAARLRGVGWSHTNLDMRSYLAFFSTTNYSTQCVSVLVATSGSVALTNVWNLGMLEFVLTQLQRSEL